MNVKRIFGHIPLTCGGNNEEKEKRNITAFEDHYRMHDHGHYPHYSHMDFPSGN